MLRVVPFNSETISIIRIYSIYKYEFYGRENFIDFYLFLFYLYYLEIKSFDNNSRWIHWIQNIIIIFSLEMFKHLGIKSYSEYKYNEILLLIKKFLQKVNWNNIWKKYVIKKYKKIFQRFFSF